MGGDADSPGTLGRDANPDGGGGLDPSLRDFQRASLPWHLTHSVFYFKRLSLIGAGMPPNVGVRRPVE